MNTVLSLLRSLSRRYKIIILFCIDFVTAFAVWFIFGPPFTALIASNFQISMLGLVNQNLYNFIVPTILTFTYLINSGFYRSSIRYSESRDLIARSFKGASLFGISWGLVYSAEYEIVRNQFLFATILKSMFLSYVFYAFLQISRDVARMILNSPKKKWILVNLF